MKQSIKYSLLFSTLIILILLFIRSKIEKSAGDNLHQIINEYYLIKSDSFSDYRIVKKSCNEYKLIIANVEKVYNSPKEFLAQYKEESTVKYLYLAKKTGEIVFIKNYDKLIKAFKENEIKWVEPRHFSEQNTFVNPKKLARFILAFVVIVIFLYIVIKLFNLKRITIN